MHSLLKKSTGEIKTIYIYFYFRLEVRLFIRQSNCPKFGVGSETDFKMAYLVSSYTWGGGLCSLFWLIGSSGLWVLSFSPLLADHWEYALHRMCPSVPLCVLIMLFHMAKCDVHTASGRWCWMVNPHSCTQVFFLVCRHEYRDTNTDIHTHAKKNADECTHHL